MTLNASLSMRATHHACHRPVNTQKGCTVEDRHNTVTRPEFDELGRPDQAADMGRQNAVGLVRHGRASGIVPVLHSIPDAPRQRRPAGLLPLGENFPGSCQNHLANADHPAK